MKRYKEQLDWMHGLMIPMIGMTVTAVGYDDEGFPFITLRRGNRIQTLMFSKDAEGNGPGFPLGLEDVNNPAPEQA